MSGWPHRHRRLPADPPITAIVQPIAEMTARAAGPIIARQTGRPAPDTPTVVPATLAVRGSTTPSRG